jgi:hypothetical protein
LAVEQQEAPEYQAEDAERLEERLEHAIQPVIADFQQHLAEAVEQRLASVRLEGVGQPDEQEETDTGSEQHDENRVGPALHHTLLNLEHQGSEWLQTAVSVAINAFFSSAVRAAVQEQLDEAVHDLLSDVFSGLPTDEETSADLRKRTEQTTQKLLEDMLCEIFEGSVREEVKFHADEAVQALSRLDFEVAARHGEDTIEALVLGVVRALGRHWGDVVHLLLKLVIESLQTMFSSTAAAGFATVIESSEKAEEKGEELQETFEEKTQELGDKLREASETLRQRVSEESEAVRRRLKDGVENGTRGRQLGRPPSHGPLGRAPSGKPPAVSGKLGRAPGSPPPGSRAQRSRR